MLVPRFTTWPHVRFNMEYLLDRLANRVPDFVDAFLNGRLRVASDLGNNTWSVNDKTARYS